MMGLLGLILILSFWNRLDAAPADIIPEQNVLMTEISRKQQDITNEKFNPDVSLDTPGMIRKAGYLAEIHNVTTEDGYILKLHRIPGGNGSLPVLLQHGYLACSADWVYLGKGKGLAYLLADQGYDVWLGNLRGNIYSNTHTFLSRSNLTFWDFSFHEMGMYDLPTMITYITKMRSQPLHAYVGHSMGTTSFYVMASKRPEIARMVKMMVGLAPAVFIDHMKSVLQSIIPFANELKAVMDNFFHGEFLNREWVKFFAKFCNQDKSRQKLCVDMIFMITGYNYDFNYTFMLPVLMSHDFAGSSIKPLIHFAQEWQSGKFRQYDYGREKNMLIYNSPEPPDYDVTKITVPIYLFYSKNDLLINPVNVKKFAHLLPTLLGLYEIPNFNHLDYILAENAPKLLYERIIKLFKGENPKMLRLWNNKIVLINNGSEVWLQTDKYTEKFSQ